MASGCYNSILQPRGRNHRPGYSTAPYLVCRCTGTRRKEQDLAILLYTVSGGGIHSNGLIYVWTRAAVLCRIIKLRLVLDCPPFFNITYTHRCRRCHRESQQLTYRPPRPLALYSNWQGIKL